MRFALALDLDALRVGPETTIPKHLPFHVGQLARPPTRTGNLSWAATNLFLVLFYSLAFEIGS